MKRVGINIRENMRNFIWTLTLANINTQKVIIYVSKHIIDVDRQVRCTIMVIFLNTLNLILTANDKH